MKKETIQRNTTYAKVHDHIKEAIDLGVYAVGSLLPPEMELCKMYGASRTTIRRAIKMLQEEGIVKVKQGRGTTVLDYRTTQRLNQVTSFSETLKAKGYEISAGSISIEVVKPPKNIADTLLLFEDERAYKMTRIQEVNGKPIAILTNYLRREIAPGLVGDVGKFISLYEHLETKYGVIITSARDTITAKSANEEEAARLGLVIGSPLMVDIRVAYSYDTPIEYVTMLIDATKMEFCVELRDRPNSRHNLSRPVLMD